MRGLCRCPDEPIDSGFTETERSFGQGNSVDVIRAAKTAKCRFAGRIARMQGLDIVHRMLKVRHFAWWRAEQAKIHTNRGLRLHDSRFIAQYRWEGTVGSVQRARR